MSAPNIENIDSVSLFERFDPKNKLHLYYERIMVENKRVNLVSRETSIKGLEKLAAESLAPFYHNPELSPILVSKDDCCHGHYMDIGSGGGFPGIPIAIAGNFESSLLIERRQKKASALTRICLALDIKAGSDPRSFEEISFNQQFDLITMRLVRLDDQFLALIIKLLTAAGKFLYYSDYPDPESMNLSIQRGRYAVDNKEDPLNCTIFDRK